MPQLIVRNIEDAVVRKLRIRAAHDGVSMEEEHRRILRDVLLGESVKKRLSFLEFLQTMPDSGDDSAFDRPRGEFREVDL